MEVQGKLLDKNSSPVKNTEITFTTNPTFVSKPISMASTNRTSTRQKYTVRAYNFDKVRRSQIVATGVAVGGKDETIKTLTAPFTIARGGGGGGAAVAAVDPQYLRAIVLKQYRKCYKPRAFNYASNNRISKLSMERTLRLQGM